MKTIKITKIDYSTMSACGQSLHSTHYYVNGKKISLNSYLHNYSDLEWKGYKWTNQEFKHNKNKNGIDRYYTINTFTLKD